MSRRRRFSVRARAAIAAAAALLPVLVAVAALGVLLQQRQLEDAVRLVAEEQARSVARDVDADPGPISLSPTLGGEETLVQVVDDRGEVVAATAEVEGAAAMVAAPGTTTRSAVLDGLAADDEQESFAAVAVPVDSGGYVVAARSLESVEAATGSTLQLLAVGVPLVTGLVALLSWVLVGRSLSPVEALRRRAGEVTAVDLHQRLPVEATGDEIERLARTLNDMLARLEESAVAQRRFVADASHELRSPVASIRAVMEVAPAGTPEWEEARADVVAETQRLEELVAGMLALARSDASAPTSRNKQPLPVSAWLDEELARVRRTPLSVERQADPLVRADADALRRVVRNLLDNADRHARGRIGVQVLVDDAEAVVRVEDDGAGIPAADADRIFDRFVRLDESRARDAGGTGLGLAIARSIAHDHGGTLAVTTSAPAGARFELRLPVAPLAG